MTIPEKLQQLRAAMADQKIDAYLIPSADPHQSEYVADHWKGRQWISGFTGSAGLVVVTAGHAGLWTDSRYFLQAESQLAGTGIQLQKQKVPHAPEHIDWLAENLLAGARVGIDGRLFSIGQVRHLQRALERKGIQLQIDLDLLSGIWTDQPPLPPAEVFEHELRYAGRSRGEKLREVSQKMATRGVDGYLITTLDDIAWLLNLRGQDVECNPVFYSFLFLEPGGGRLFVEEKKVPAGLRTNLQAAGIELQAYATVGDFLQALPAGKKVLIDPASANAEIYAQLSHAALQEGDNIVLPLKAIKNETEIGHIREVMVKDGVALLKLYRWLEATLQERSVPEAEVAERLDQFRREQGDYFGESFSAIVGYNANGAIIHYRPEYGSCADIRPEGILLLDSGGQYRNGTTDITRTTALSTPTAEQKRHFTLVLKGHITLAMARFPVGVNGMQLDAFARMHLWNACLNFGHGTGHGVGFFLNVHEPPQGFAASNATSRGTTAFAPGMFTSNEPGFYLTGQYGIRIENLVLCREAGETEFGKFLEFETTTLFPIDRQLIEVSMLTTDERQWLNDYHREVYERLSPQLDERERQWLAERCGEI